MQPSGRFPAKVMIVGEAPGEEEERRGIPFVGPSGMELDRMLAEVGLSRGECLVTNVCRVRPASNDIGQFFSLGKRMPKGEGWTPVQGGFAREPVIRGMELLAEELTLCQPQVIVPVGNLALWALTGTWGILKWRGSSLKAAGVFASSLATVIPTVHPAAILRQWSLRSYAISDLRRVAKLVREGRQEPPQYSFIIRPQLDTALSTLHSLRARLDSGESLHLACDIETRAGMMACIGLAWSRTEALCIPLMCIERQEGYWSLEEETAVVEALRRVLTHPQVHISGQNFQYDSQYIHREWGFVPNLSLDTMLCQNVLFPGTEKALHILSSLYCEHHVYWKDDGKEWHSKMGEDTLWSYNCMDAVRTWEIAEAMCGAIRQLGREAQAQFQHRMWWRSMEIMIRGVRCSVGEKRALAPRLEAERLERERWLEDILGHPLNPRSPKQMQELFYHDFQIKPVLKRQPDGRYTPTLNDEALSIVGVREPLVQPLVRRIQEIRSLGVYKSTFVDASLDSDQRYRCSYNVAGTSTFRLSSSQNPFGSGLNLQNIPSGEDEVASGLQLPNVRQLFIPDPGYEIADMDLSSADLRVVVREARCRFMQELLDEGRNPYVELTRIYYDNPRLGKDSSHYRQFKSLAHGTNYLGTPQGLAGRIGLNVRDVEKVQHWYFTKCPEIHDWQQAFKRRFAATKLVENAYGYKRFFFDRIQGTIFNEAVAWIPQSTIGLLINHLWDKIAEVPGIQVLMQVHDSLVFQYPLADRERCLAAVQAVAAAERIPYATPLYIPIGLKTSAVSWGDCK